LELKHRLRLQGTGVVLFLFIPVVLFLFVKHPPPLGVSLGAGVVLMLGHRFVARPYMQAVRPLKCIWCNAILTVPEGKRLGETAALELGFGAASFKARVCQAHQAPAARFFAFLHAWRWPLRLGIFVPLLFLLLALAAAAAGQPAPVELATGWFKLVVGVTVNLAAFGYFVTPARDAVPVPFPVHNFFLLGVRNLLWIFRLVGLWWIWQGIVSLL
jgi:hypothetical protein